MALPDLAAAADLTARGVTPGAVHTTMLAVASSLVRAAAGSPILSTTSTVELTGWGGVLLPLPGLPIRTIYTVLVDGVEVTDYRLVDRAQLWRASGWGHPEDPIPVTVTMTHGLAVVPEHIKQLVCDLAILGAGAATAGAHDPRVLVEKVDDYSVSFAAGAESLASAMELPRATKLALKAAFGGGAGVVTYR